MKTCIIVPTYNSEKFLPRTLDSIYAQTRKPDAIFLVDNDSDESILAVSMELNKERDPMIPTRGFQGKKNIGRIPNWNRCLDIFRESEYDAMKFVFAGDTIEPNCLELQLSVLNDHVPIVTCGHTVVVDEMKSWKMKHFPKYETFTPKKALEHSLIKGNWFAGCTACPLFTKEALGDLYFDETMDWASDWLFWAQLCSTNNIAFIPETLANFMIDARKGFAKLQGTVQAKNEEAFVRSFLKMKTCE